MTLRHLIWRGRTEYCEYLGDYGSKVEIVKIWKSEYILYKYTIQPAPTPYENFLYAELFFCLFVGLSTCMSVYMPVCLYVCMSVRLSVCPPFCIPARLFAFLLACLYSCPPAACPPVYLPSRMLSPLSSVCLWPACWLHVWLPVRRHKHYLTLLKTEGCVADWKLLVSDPDPGID